MQFLNNKDRAGSLLLLLFSLVYLRYALELPLDPMAGDESFSARTLPVGLSVAAIVFALIDFFLGARRGGDNRISEAVKGFSWMPALLLVLLMVVYSLIFDSVGFILASYLFLQLGFLILGERRYLHSAIVASGLVLFLWLMLTQAFGVYLDPGDLYRFVIGMTP